MRWRPGYLTILFVWLIFGYSLQYAQADEARLTLMDGLIATAAYKAGNPELPAVLILHGFLQTRDSPTVHQLAESLSDIGYTVLSPNLSLGISKRNKSLVCEAIHLHSMEGDLKEIDTWVNWLVSKGHNQIVLIGHNYGSLMLIAYLSSHPNPAVRKLIAVSLVDAQVDMGGQQWQKTETDLQHKLNDKDASLVQYALSFCKKYPTSAQNYMSYASWQRTRVLKVLSHLRVPVTIIIGDGDTRLGASWASALKKANPSLVVIKGADHFMSGKYQFDLLNAVLVALRLPQAKQGLSY
ncbi:alpha/beta fold hydrolase [Sulfuriferula sp.]|uniref:alpha/beta fold hydrolase n=1 Tax=Sulfuriferula sp. TaxID=2025307 RepID=UPI00272F8DE1|nr:alpha/beta fold hydrolase [Sulfuriferula sp.]MDP2026662.1 alpha/beta fold hydrolase [Sulfuriferula sp.]